MSFYGLRINYLGCKLSSRGLKVDKAKIATIEKLPPPINVKGVRSFLSCVGFYRRFIKDFSNIMKPFYSLLEKDHLFISLLSLSSSFNIIKEK